MTENKAVPASGDTTWGPPRPWGDLDRPPTKIADELRTSPSSVQALSDDELEAMIAFERAYDDPRGRLVLDVCLTERDRRLRAARG